MDDHHKDDRWNLWVGRVASIIGGAGFVYELLKGKSVEFAIVCVGIAGVGFGRSIERFLEWITTFRPPSSGDS